MSILDNSEIKIYSDGRIFIGNTDTEINITDVIDIKNIVDNFEGYNKDYFQGNIKEEKKMKILEIYKENRIKEIEETYNIEKEKIREKDEIQKNIKELKEKINTLLKENENTSLTTLSLLGYIFTDKTCKQLDTLDEENKIKLQNLDKLIEEIEAQLEIAPDYEAKMKIMKDYGVIDKKTGKII